VSGGGKSDVVEVGAPRRPAVRRAAWLSDEVLLLACVAGKAVEGKAFAGPVGTIVAAPALDALEAEDVRQALTDLRTFLREGPAGWDAATRASLLGFLAALGTEHGLSASLGEGLRQAREALRERRPLAIEDRRVGRGVAIERLHRIDERSFYVRGRAWDETATIASIAATSPEGERVDLLERVFRHAGLDDRFIGLFQLAAPTRGADGWVVEIANGNGRAVEIPASLAPDPFDSLFADAGRDFDGADALRERHIRPAIARLNELRRASAGIVEVAAYGRIPPSPPISLIVPLQRRVDLIEHQLAQFAADPEVGECELLYVLEDSEQRDGLEELAGELFGLYGLPFRVAVLTEAAGLPIACNLGASIAAADRLLFAGADVLPDRPGWLGAMAAALDADPRAAAATPKLLYADEAIDQAGLEHSRVETSGEWALRHRLRGMHRGVPAAADAGSVAAAGLACLMIDAAPFHEVGGLRTELGLADYEGADLSLRLAEAGRGVLYVPEAELYRLEGLGAAPEPLGERYARWLHSRLWGPATAAAGA
jgi:GT2 family glycosyltransferase